MRSNILNYLYEKFDNIDIDSRIISYDDFIIFEIADIRHKSEAKNENDIEDLFNKIINEITTNFTVNIVSNEKRRGYLKLELVMRDDKNDL